MTLPTGWLDVHGHFLLPFANEQQRLAYVRQIRQAGFLIPDEWSWTVEDTMYQMNQTNVQMQLLSYIPPALASLQTANNHAAGLVERHPTRFGFLCALPTDNPEACILEIARTNDLAPDGYAVTTVRGNVTLSDAKLEPVWAKLDAVKAVVFAHPNASAPAQNGRPVALVEAAFETCRVIVDMLYSGVFRRYPNVRFIFAHCGGALPILMGRLELLGGESWLPNPEMITSQEIAEQLKRLHVDCAASAKTGLKPAMDTVGRGHVLYGSDCGVPCSSHATMLKNRDSVLQIERELGMEAGSIGRNAWKLFPRAAARASKSNL